MPTPETWFEETIPVRPQLQEDAASVVTARQKERESATDGSKVCPFGTCARPLSPMESAIHDVYSHLNQPGSYGHGKAAAGLRQRRLYTYSRGTLLRGYPRPPSAGL
jgi:hypothetical protein